MLPCCADAPPITFVVVQKRHNTRLFPTPQDQQNRDRSGNCLPGEGVQWSGGRLWLTNAAALLNTACFTSTLHDQPAPAACAIPAGTVVDTAINHPFEFDFYLNSHAGLQARMW